MRLFDTRDPSKSLFLADEKPSFATRDGVSAVDFDPGDFDGEHGRHENAIGDARKRGRERGRNHRVARRRERRRRACYYDRCELRRGELEAGRAPRVARDDWFIILFLCICVCPDTLLLLY